MISQAKLWSYTAWVQVYHSLLLVVWSLASYLIPVPVSSVKQGLHNRLWEVVLRKKSHLTQEKHLKQKTVSLLLSNSKNLKCNIQKPSILASSPITSWQIEGKKVEAVTDFVFFSSKITAESDWSHEIKRRLLLGRKAMTNLDSIKK